MNKKLIKSVIIKTLPVMAGYIVLGIGFGILLRVNGYGLPYALLMSIFIYAGSLQYVGVALMSGGASLITTALTSLMVNARHLFYGISMVDKYKGAGKWKPYLMLGLTDETYSLVCDGDYPEGENKYRYWFLISLFNQFYWVLGSVIGSVVGVMLKFNTAGIEFSMTALFVTVFVEQWLGTKEHRPAILGLLLTVICLVIFGSESFLIPAMIMIAGVLTIMKKPLERR